MAINYAFVDPLDMESLKVDGTTVNTWAIPVEIIIIMGSNCTSYDGDLRGKCVFITNDVFSPKAILVQSVRHSSSKPGVSLLVCVCVFAWLGYKTLKAFT